MPSVQPLSDEFLDGEITADELAEEEASWLATYEANKEYFRALAREALLEMDAREARKMIFTGEKICKH